MESTSLLELVSDAQMKLYVDFIIGLKISNIQTAKLSVVVSAVIK